MKLKKSKTDLRDRIKLTEETKKHEVKITRVEEILSGTQWNETKRKHWVDTFEQYLILANTADMLRDMGAKVEQTIIDTEHGKMVVKDVKYSPDGNTRITYDYEVAE